MSPPIPFTLRVAVEWFHADDRDASERTLAFIPSCTLTGSLSTTDHGRDVQASDLSVDV